MAFAPKVPRVPTTIGQVYIELVDEDGTNPNRQARFSVEVFDQDGERVKPANGNLVSHLAPADVTWLIDFQNRMRIKAEAEIIP